MYAHNRVETHHAALKKYLGSGRGTLDTVFEKIHAQITLRIVELKASFERSRSEIPVHVARVHYFRYLQTNCSRKALNILLKLHNI